MKGLPNKGTPLLEGSLMAREWYDFMIDLGLVANAIRNGTSALRSYTVSTLPDPASDGLLAFCTDEVGGAVPVFSLAGQWRRVTDRAVVS